MICASENATILSLSQTLDFQQTYQRLKKKIKTVVCRKSISRGIVSLSKKTYSRLHTFRFDLRSFCCPSPMARDERLYSRSRQSLRGTSWARTDSPWNSETTVYWWVSMGSNSLSSRCPTKVTRLTFYPPFVLVCALRRSHLSCSMVSLRREIIFFCTTHLLIKIF